MSALDHYMQIHSNGKASVGAYEVTPVFQSSLSNEEDLKNNLSTIRTAMINIQNMNEGETVLLVAKYVLKDGKDDVYLWFR